MRNAATGRLVTSMPLGAVAERRWGAPYLVAHRADLQAALVAAVADHGNIELEAGAEVVDIAMDDERVHVRLGAGREGERHSGVALVGADGVWSRLRGHVRAQGASSFSGHVAWRATVAADAVPGGLMADDRITVLFSPRFHLVAYPLRKARLFNLVAITAGAPESGNPDIARTTAARPDALASALAGTVVAGLEGAAQWLPWPLHTVDWRLPWHRDRLVLTGDAAHALTPFAAQGAAMAIEDAAVLADCLAAAGSPAAAFARFQALRSPRIGRVARRGSFNRFAWHAFGPVAFARDVVLSLRPGERLLADFDWLYGWNG